MDNPVPSPQNWPNLSNQDNRPKPPPPPPPEITLRTMKSDLDSLKQTGGANPTPKPFTPPEIKSSPITPPTPPPAPPTPPTPPAAPKISPTNFPFQKPEEKKVSLEQFSKPDELSKIGAPKTIPGLPPATPGSSKKIKLIILISVLLVVGIGSALLGYYVIFPKFFPSETITETTSEPETNQFTENTLPTEEVTPIENLIIHQSFVSTISSSVAPIAVTDSISLKNSIFQESQKTAANDSLAEVVLQNQQATAISSNKILPMIFPEFSAESLIGLEDDFTFVLYYDANGVWPAYVFKIKPEFTAAQIQNSINGIIETSNGLKNLFISDPGTANVAGFKTGQTSGIATRYLTFTKAGASLNLAWTNDKFIISSSYNGAKKILSNLK